MVLSKGLKIAVISDTHMPSRAKSIPRALQEGIAGVDLILHAGDWTNPKVIESFEEIAPVEGVAGNNDGPEIIERFGRKKILSLGGFRIGLVHGDGTRKTTEFRAWEAFQHEQVDIVLFGHSHIPFDHNVQGIWLFNPGSPTDKRRQARFSYGMLTLEEQIKAEHFYYEDKS